MDRGTAAPTPSSSGCSAPRRACARSSPRTEAELQGRGIDCSTLVDEGDPGEVLVRLATDCEADVLVIGNKGMHRRVLGSVPNTVTHNAPCSVFVVKTT